MKKSIRSLSMVIPVGILAGVAALSTGAKPANVKEDKLAKIKEAVPTEAAAKPAKKHKVLVFSKTNGFRHGSIPTGTEAMRQLGESTGVFEVVHSEDEAMFEPDKLKEFDGVIFLNTTGEVFRPKKLPGDEAGKKAALEREEMLKKSLVDYVSGGGALIGMHSATDTYKRWDEFNKMMGGAFDGHPWHMKVKAKNLDPGHPVNKAFDGKDLEVTDEIYQFRAGTGNAGDRRMLLGLSGELADLKKGKREDGFYAISWVSEYGKGKTFYCSLGHRDEIYWNPMVLRHYLAGIQFALGDLEADATPKEVAATLEDAGIVNLAKN